VLVLVLVLVLVPVPVSSRPVTSQHRRQPDRSVVDFS
jgi:hypothetical protein